MSFDVNVDSHFAGYTNTGTTCTMQRRYQKLRRPHPMPRQWLLSFLRMHRQTQSRYVWISLKNQLAFFGVLKHAWFLYLSWFHHVHKLLTRKYVHNCRRGKCFNPVARKDLANGYVRARWSGQIIRWVHRKWILR